MWEMVKELIKISQEEEQHQWRQQHNPEIHVLTEKPDDLTLFPGSHVMRVEGEELPPHMHGTHVPTTTHN